MRWLGSGRLIAAIGLACFVATAYGDATSEPQTADEWREAARTAALAGDRPAYAEALRAAVKLDPDHAPARADRGEVQFEGRWLPVDYAQHLASADDQLAEYEKLRSAASDTPADHARLARWCDRRGLTDEARPHWLMVLQDDPTNAAALKALNAEWREGKLWDQELADEAEEKAAIAARAEKAWESRLKRLERGRGGEEDAAIELFIAEADEHAASPIERRVAELNGGTSRLDRRRRHIVEAYINATDRLQQIEVTASLCRIAIQSAEEPLRDWAIEALEDREPFDVMPLLLATLRSTVESSHEVSFLPQGGVAYEHRFKTEGQEVDQQLERHRVAHVPIEGIERLPTVDLLVKAVHRTRVRLLQHQLAMRVEAADTEALVAEYNETVAQGNERVLETLERVTDLSLGDEPRAWWDYWQRYSGYDVPYERPVARRYESESIVDRAYVPPQPPHECFVAGTPVWTKQGKQAIETLKRGDLVLARDPDRGGLTYRVVLQRTTRRPSPMVEIVAGDEAIHATEGHPFWVIGKGWTMAKHLAEDDVLSSVNGPIVVASASEYEDREAFNLIVEGAANYYVGESGVLVHDNTPRRPAVGLVANR